jgi:CrcB protein
MSCPAENVLRRGFCIPNNAWGVRVLAKIALVAFGGAIGSLARWGVGLAVAGWLERFPRTAFPWGTFIINVTGCLFLGWFTTLLNERLALAGAGWLTSENLRLMIAVGFTGAYTTFSTFEYEANDSFSKGDGLVATLYIISSVVLGLLAVRLGVILARR